MVFDSIPKPLPRSAIRFSPCWPCQCVEIPHLLLVTTISSGSGLAGRDGQIRQVGKSPSAVPASPPVTMVIPRRPARCCAIAVPGALEYCTAIGLESGLPLHAGLGEWPAAWG